MKTDIGALRRDAEGIEDIDDREMALRGVHELESIEFDTERRRAQLLHEFRDKTYKPQSKFPLGLLAIFCLSVDFGMGYLLLGILESGMFEASRTGHIFTVDANPVIYWFQVSLYTLFSLVMVLVTIGIVIAFIKHPQIPKWNARKRT